MQGLRRGEEQRDGTQSNETVEDFVRVGTATTAEEGAAADPEPRADGLRDDWLHARDRQRGFQADESGEGRWQDSRWGQGRDQWDWQDSWSWRDDWWSSSSRSKDYADPPAWAGWPNYRLWKRSIQRWDQSTDVAINRRAERIFKTMDWDLQARFEHLSDATITGPDYLTAVLEILDVLAGESRHQR